ncbi:MAG: hypothetical protein IJ497_12020 [Clostridia bacterium]|nr:hypothetical protein [Clostridia bacterium]
MDSKEQEIQRIVKKAFEFYKNNHAEYAVPILEEGLRRYPTSHRLMFQLARVYQSCKLKAVSDETCDHYNKEIIRLCAKVRSESTDDQIRIGATQTLCYTYSDLGMLNEISEIAKSQPNIFATREVYALLALTGTQKYEYNRVYFTRLLDTLLGTMKRFNKQLDDGSYPYSKEEEAEIAKKVLAVFDIVFEDGNYGFFRGRVIHQHKILSGYYSKCGDRENALHYLEEAAQQAVIADTVDKPQESYTCLLLRGRPFGEGILTSNENACLSLLNHMAQSCFDFIRDEERFTAVTEQLSPHAAER